MFQNITIKDSIREKRLFLNRSTFLFIIVLTLTIGLIARLTYLQIMGHEHYANLAQDNRVKIAPLPPTRGIIYDRSGNILAENRPVFNLEITPEQVPDLDKTIEALSALLVLDERTIKRFHKLRRRSKSFNSIPIKLRLSDEEVAQFAVNRPRFPGVDIHARLMRHYPYKGLTAHVVGYVGRINEKELKSIDAKSYRGTHQIGKNGIEKTYEALLHGLPGFLESEVNVQGRTINIIERSVATAGQDLHLTLDIEMQRIASEALGDKNGAVVAIDIETGGLLTFVSKPSYDPNPFVYGIDHKSYNALQFSHERPLFNRALRGQYPPGSTIKPFIGLAGLRHSLITARQKNYCPGFYQLPNLEHRYRDWKKWGHGAVDLDIAITQSCDVYFYDLALTLGIDRLHDYLSQFGFGQRTGIDILGEKRGLLPSRAWKRKTRNQAWFPGETLITGIGQGFTLVTPLQLARATAIMATRGENVQPHIVQAIGSDKSSTPFNPPAIERAVDSPPSNSVQWQQVIDAMTHVIHGARGTARSLSEGISYKIAGKTGTAQVFSVGQEDEYDEEELAEKLHDHALFIAFAPVKSPQIAISVIVENGKHGGSVAAPIAGKLIKYYLGD
jgi:penicillin-binding protein 2